MTSVIFTDWLLDLDKDFIMQKKTTELIIDNFPAHFTDELKLTSS